MPKRLRAKLAMLCAAGLAVVDNRRDAAGAGQSLPEVRYLTDRDEVVIRAGQNEYIGLDLSRRLIGA